MNVDNDFSDREYNPRAQIPAFADFFLRWKQDAQKTRESLPARLDLAYGTAAAETLDFFPASEAGAPLLIFIHGGYWRVLDKADFSWIAPPYVAAGISGAIQHKVGMQTAGTIIAVNRDPDAPIAGFADMFVVGDLFEIGPALLAALRARRG